MSDVKNKDVVIQDEEDSDNEAPSNAQTSHTDPDEFFAKNAFRIIYQTNNFFLPQVNDLIEKREVLNLRPEYQRRLRWKTSQKSRLIESLLLNIPVPPIFLYENSAARYEVMDGQQRLNAVSEFIKGDYALTGLQVLLPLNGLRYSKCPPRVKRSLDRSSLSAIVLLLESEPSSDGGRFTLTDIRRFIFDRLNTGGVKLNKQEIRNAIYGGSFNDAIIDLARFSKFTEIFGIPPYVESDPNDYYENPARQKNPLYSSMADCQLVLRYFALKDEANIRGSMKSMLDRAMEDRKSISNEQATQLKTEYQDRLSFLFELFDGRPFELSPDDRGKTRVSAAIYDASMVAINRLWAQRDTVLQDKPGVQRRMRTVLLAPENAKILTGQANTAQAVKDRIQLITRVFSEASLA
jgi:hypothetical protein